MNVKKTKFSDIIWIIYSVVALGFGFLIFTRAVDEFGFDIGFGIAFTLLILAVSFGFSFLSIFVRKKIGREKLEKRQFFEVISWVLAAVFIIAGLVIRLLKVSNGEYNADGYYELLKIGTADISNSIHGVTNWYFYILHNILFIFGNHMEAAMGLQIILQLFCIVFVFLAIKRLCGRFSALSVVGFWMLMPYTITQSLTLGPQMFYLALVSLDLFLFAYYIPVRKRRIAIGVIAGLFLGLLIYLDVSGIVLLLLLPYIFFAEKKNSKKRIRVNLKVFAFLIFMLFVIIGFAACLFVDYSFSDRSFGDFISDFALLYLPETVGTYSLSGVIDIASGIILASLLILGIPAGFMRKDKDQGSLFVLMLLLLIGISGIVLPIGNIDGTPFILLISTILAGGAISAITSNLSADSYYEVNACDIEDDEYDNEEDDLEEVVIENESDSLKDNNEDLKEVKLLYNPLPIPEKVKKGTMDYDYEVSDDADYDI